MRRLAAFAFACAATPAFAQDTVLDALNDLQAATTGPSVEEVQAISERLYAVTCPTYEDAYTEEPRAYDIRYRYEFDDISQPERLMVLYQLWCYAGAYNAAYVFFVWDESVGLWPLALPYPRIDVRYPEDPFDDTRIEGISITGYSSQVLITNPEYDPENQALKSHGYWRGIGDASSTATWRFSEGTFVLETFSVDPTYDGEINPFVLIDFSRPHPVKVPK